MKTTVPILLFLLGIVIGGFQHFETQLTEPTKTEIVVAQATNDFIVDEMDETIEFVFAVEFYPAPKKVIKKEKINKSIPISDNDVGKLKKVERSPEDYIADIGYNEYKAQVDNAAAQLREYFAQERSQTIDNALTQLNPVGVSVNEPLADWNGLP